MIKKGPNVAADLESLGFPSSFAEQVQDKYSKINDKAEVLAVVSGLTKGEMASMACKITGMMPSAKLNKADLSHIITDLIVKVSIE